jgi:hypothetical protein
MTMAMQRAIPTMTTPVLYVGRSGSVAQATPNMTYVNATDTQSSVARSLRQYRRRGMKERTKGPMTQFRMSEIPI